MVTKIIRRKFRRLRRTLKQKRTVFPVLLVLLFAGILTYAWYMNNRRLSVDPVTYSSLLSLIGKAESNDNYNAHFGNAGNKKVKFTDMTLAEVMEWQSKFVKDGSPSSAVGRYQIISPTLVGLVKELQLRHDQKFDEPTQDKLAIALLERRGSEKYVNKELTQKEFAANLAQEWAALPKVIGNKPEQSYYAGDGLNASRVSIPAILRAIEPISPL